MKEFKRTVFGVVSDQEQLYPIVLAWGKILFVGPNGYILYEGDPEEHKQFMRDAAPIIADLLT